MRCVVQRVKDCRVITQNKEKGYIHNGLLVYLGISKEDNEIDVNYIVNKIVGLRVFNDKNGKMNKSIQSFPSYSILVVSQFTLYGNVTRGLRPSYDRAADPNSAKNLYEYFVTSLKDKGYPPETGQFQASMEVTCTNCGPVTILIDSEKTF